MVAESGGSFHLKIKTILEMRRGRNAAVYYDFIDHFVSLVVGKRYYNLIHYKQRISDYATPSDEALAILMFENNYARWEDMAKRNDTRSSTVLPLYTNGGVSDGEVASNQRYQGWSDEGLDRFNVLFRRVKEDRATDVGKRFETEFKAHCLVKYIDGQDRKKRKPIGFDEDGNPLAPKKAVKIAHELWSDDEEDESAPDWEGDGSVRADDVGSTSEQHHALQQGTEFSHSTLAAQEQEASEDGSDDSDEEANTGNISRQRAST
jgi:hypothetical protein